MNYSNNFSAKQRLRYEQIHNHNPKKLLTMIEKLSHALPNTNTFLFCTLLQLMNQSQSLIHCVRLISFHVIIFLMSSLITFIQSYICTSWDCRLYFEYCFFFLFTLVLDFLHYCLNFSWLFS